MKRLLIVFLLFVVLSSCKQEDQKYDSTNTIYTLEAYVNEEDDRLTVEGEVSYYNEIEDLDELYLHIYPN